MIATTRACRYAIIASMIALLSACLSACAPRDSHILFYTAPDGSPEYAVAQTMIRYLSPTAPRAIERRHIGYEQRAIDYIDEIIAMPNRFAIIPSDILALHMADNTSAQTTAQLRSVVNLFPRIVFIVASAEYQYDFRYDRLNAPILIADDDISQLAPIARSLFSLRADQSAQATPLPLSTIAERFSVTRNGFYMFSALHPFDELTIYNRSQPPIRLHPLLPQQTEQVTALFPALAVTTIPIARYPALINETDVPALYFGNILITSAATDAHIIDTLCRELIDNFSHYRSLYPFLANMRIADLTHALVVPQYAPADSCQAI